MLDSALRIIGWSFNIFLGRDYAIVLHALDLSLDLTFTPFYDNNTKTYTNDNDNNTNNNNCYYSTVCKATFKYLNVT